jgi:WD40 repeat protein
MKENNTKKSANGTEPTQDLIGVLRIYRNDPSFTICFESKEAKKWISELKFSPDGRTLAMGAHDNNIYLYNINQNYKRKAKFSKHSAAILHFDFTSDGKYLQSNCNAYEMLFCDSANGQQITNGASMLVDAEWATMTCPLSKCVSLYNTVISILCLAFCIAVLCSYIVCM